MHIIIYTKTINSPKEGMIMNTINDIIHQKISFHLGELGISQYELAMRCGIPNSTIKSIMQKKTKGISLKTIILLSDGLGMHPSEFISGEEFLAENLNLD